MTDIVVWHARSVAISTFMANLRSRFGNGLLVLPGVSVLVFNEAGHMLLARNVGGASWSPIGGMVAPYEHPMSAARRELLEETGLTAHDLALIGATGGPEYFVRYRNGDEVSYVTTVWRCHATHEDVPVADSDEIETLRWFDRGELATADLSAFLRALLTEFEESLFPSTLP